MKVTATWKDSGASDLLLKLQGRLKNPGPLTKSIADLVGYGEIQSILNSVSVYGSPFATLKRLLAGKTPRPPGHGQDPRPLIDSGSGLGSIRVIVQGRSARVGSTMPYMRWQNDGDYGGSAREWMGIRPEDRSETIPGMVSDYVRSGIVPGGLYE